MKKVNFNLEEVCHQPNYYDANMISLDEIQETLPTPVEFNNEPQLLQLNVR